MLGGASVNRQVRPEVIAQGIDELIEEARHPELQFRWRRRRHGAHLDLRPTAADELFAILGDEVVQHIGPRKWLWRRPTARLDHRLVPDALHCIEAEPLAPRWGR